MGGGRVIEFNEVSLGPNLDIELQPAPPPSPHVHVPRPVKAHRSEKPSVRRTAPRRPPVRRQFAVALFNVASAALVGLVALVTIAWVRAPRPLSFEDLGFPIVWLALGFDDGADDEPLRLAGVHTGTYLTRSGEEIFFVRGAVENTSSAPVEAATVTMELLRSGQILHRGESLAQLSASPEDVHALEPADNERLQRHLAGHAASWKILPRTRAPFIAVFPTSTQQLHGAEVRLALRPGTPASLQDGVARESERAQPLPGGPSAAVAP